MLRSTLCAAAAILAVSGLATGQVVIGHSGPAGAIVEFTTLPGAPCGQPVPTLFGCPTGPSSCTVPPPGPVVPGALLGDIADDPLTDTIYVTDGFTIGQYVGDTPCGLPPRCTPIKTFLPPTFMGPLTGMGADVSGAFTGGATLLWITDGVLIAGIIPPVGCGPAVLAVPPCPAPTITGAPLTDLSFDPVTLTLYGVEAGGFLLAYAAPGCGFAAPPVAVGGCGPMGALTGLAFDTNTPNVITGTGPAAYVTDGFMVAYIDVLTGGPAAPTFYTPVPCTPVPASAPFLTGLAMAQRGINYGASRAGSSLTSFGQSSSPGPTFGLEVSGAPAVGTSFLILNFSFPGPGYFCPALPGVGTKIWVDPTPPGMVIALPALGPGCTPLSLPIPAGAPPGLNAFAQFVFVGPGGPPALDATAGLAFTLGTP